MTRRLVGCGSASEKNYILAFVAHKFVACKDKSVTRTFAATLITQSQREHKAMRWLRSDSDAGREDSENDSTMARIN